MRPGADREEVPPNLMANDGRTDQHSAARVQIGLLLEDPVQIVLPLAGRGPIALLSEDQDRPDLLQVDLARIAPLLVRGAAPNVENLPGNRSTRNTPNQDVATESLNKSQALRCLR